MTKLQLQIVLNNLEAELEQLKKENEMLKARLNAINDNCYDDD